MSDPAVAAQVCEYATAWLAINGVHSGLVPQLVRPASHHCVLMMDFAQSAAKKSRCDAKAIAVALLRGWGLTLAEARSALKDKDV